MKHILTITTVAAGLVLVTTSSQASLTFAGVNHSQLNPVAGSIATPQLAFTGTPGTVNLASLSSTTVGSITYQQALVMGGEIRNMQDGINALTSTHADNSGVSKASYPGSVSSVAPNVTAIPEPSTVMAGAMLLLPFGISSWRTLRKQA